MNSSDYSVLVGVVFLAPHLSIEFGFILGAFLVVGGIYKEWVR